MRPNPNFQRQLNATIDNALRITAFEIVGQGIDNMATQVGTGEQYKDLPNRSSLGTSASEVRVGQFPTNVPQDAQFSVVQSGGLVGGWDARKDADAWEVGLFDVDMGKALKQEFGSMLVSPRANIYRTVVATETQQRVLKELRK